ncbi:MAG: hypothetical protein PHF09_02725 [Candidatus Nanoarchaeia archaeon]|nr:hypothetical protein [Candidatus Nanoarchaeia archaeon]MDD4563762.1 hypothetical protein [Candidatus Nanoarchaeia archaeon]
MNFKNFYLQFFGIFYIVIGIVAVFNVIIGLDSASVLWISYFAFFFIGLGILIKNSYLIGAWFNIIFIPYLIWSIDFLYHLFFNKSLWGITDYMFVSRVLISQIVSIQHIFIIPIALLSIYFIKLQKKDFWKLSLILISMSFILTRLFTKPIENVNCVFKNCLPFEIIPVLYPISWFLAFFIMIGIVNFLLVKIKKLF